MANWTSLKAALPTLIPANGNQEITAEVMQDAESAIIDALGAFAQLVGVATPDTVPGVPDGPVFYLASEAGTYSNFGGAVAESQGTHVIIWDGTSWTMTPLLTVSAVMLNSILSDLSDVPSYDAGKILKVNPTGDGLIWGDPSGSSVSWGDIAGTLANQTDLVGELRKLKSPDETVQAEATDDGLHISDYSKRMVSPKYGGTTGDYPLANTIDIEMPGTSGSGTFQFNITLLLARGGTTKTKVCNYLVTGANNSDDDSYVSIKLLNSTGNTTSYQRNINVTNIVEGGKNKIRVKHSGINDAQLIVDVSISRRADSGNVYLLLGDIVLSSPYSSTDPTLDDKQTYVENLIDLTLNANGTIDTANSDSGVSATVGAAGYTGLTLDDSSYNISSAQVTPYGSYSTAYNFAYGDIVVNECGIYHGNVGTTGHKCSVQLKIRKA